MPFTQVYWEHYGGKTHLEELLITQHGNSVGLNSRRYTLKNIRRRTLPLNPDILVVGSLPAVTGALKQLGTDMPLANTYPPCLSPYYGREFQSGTLGDWLDRISMGIESEPVFIKPQHEHKAFSGRVVRGENDIYGLQSRAKKLPVWVSNVIDLHAEYRVYVARNAILHIAHYAGDESVKPDLRVVNDMLDATLRCPDFNRAGFSIDVGVTDTGNTVVVEVNDGFSLGAYGGISAKDYFTLISSRWEQLMQGL